jgi:hypothetical protein
MFNDSPINIQPTSRQLVSVTNNVNQLINALAFHILISSETTEPI